MRAYVTISSLECLQELVMDILRVLSSPDLEVRRKTLNLALELISSRNVEEVRSDFTIFHVEREYLDVINTRVYP